MWVGEVGMNEINFSCDLKKVFSLGEDELENIFSEMSMEEIEGLLDRVNEVIDNV